MVYNENDAARSRCTGGLTRKTLRRGRLLKSVLADATTDSPVVCAPHLPVFIIGNRILRASLISEAEQQVSESGDKI
jgi:hypothetical protein